MNVSKYDLGWETRWDDMKKYGPFSQHLRRLLNSLLSSLTFETLLDVGCGQGSLLIELQTKYPSAMLSGLDFSPAAVALARQRLPQCNFYVLDITKDALDAQFDVVVCSEVLEHIPDDQAAIKNLARMTARYLIVSSPQGRIRKFEVAEMGHVRNYARGELAGKLKAHGLTPVRIIEWGFPFYSPLYRNLLELLGGRGTGGTFGPGRKAISRLLYGLFLLNSSRRGDEVIILACPGETSPAG